MYAIPANLVSCVEGWRYWDDGQLRLLAYASIAVFKIKDEDNGKGTETPH